MKFSTLLLLATLGVIVYAIFSGRGSAPATAGLPGPPAFAPQGAAPVTVAPATWPSAGSPAASPSPEAIQPRFAPTPTPAAQPGLMATLLNLLHITKPAATPRAGWDITELKIAHGTVLDRLDDGIVVESGCWLMPTHSAFATTANSHTLLSTGSTPAANAYDQDVKAYGPLMMIERGEVRPSSIDPGVFDPTKYIYGQIYIAHYPLTLMAPGKKVKVVVAYDGSVAWHDTNVPTYTAVFNLLQDDAHPVHGGWMWSHEGRTTLDH